MRGCCQVASKGQKEVKDSDTFELTLPALKAERMALVSIEKSLKKKESAK